MKKLILVLSLFLSFSAWGQQDSSSKWTNLKESYQQRKFQTKSFMFEDRPTSPSVKDIVVTIDEIKKTVKLDEIEKLKNDALTTEEPSVNEQKTSDIKENLDELNADFPGQKKETLKKWIFEAIKNSDRKELELCNKLNASFNYEYDCKKPDGLETSLICEKGDRVLHVAVRNNKNKQRPDINFFSYLIERADVCVKNNDGKKASELFICEPSPIMAGNGRTEDSKECKQVRQMFAYSEKAKGCFSPKN